ncbi:MAG: hypothetical protein K2H98_03630 [Duncaniella sp.]|nr:hypothetical protein [Duncaniella sp.]
MDPKIYNTIEEDGIVIFDESDDYVHDEYHGIDKEEIDIDYLLNQTRIQEYQKIIDQKHQRLISVGVIVAIIIFITIVSYLCFRNVL